MFYINVHTIPYPGHRFSTQLGINYRFTKLMPCYRKREVWHYNLVLPFHLYSPTCSVNSSTVSGAWLHSKRSCFTVRSGESCNYSNCVVLKLLQSTVNKFLQVMTHGVYKKCYLRRYSNNGIRRSCVKIEVIMPQLQESRARSFHWLF